MKLAGMPSGRSSGPSYQDEGRVLEAELFDTCQPCHGRGSREHHTEIRENCLAGMPKSVGPLDGEPPKTAMPERPTRRGVTG